MTWSRSFSGAFGSLLIAAALVLRVAMPAGWMPVASAQGVELVLCSGMGPMQMAAMAHVPDGGDQPAGPAHASPCGFDALAVAAAPVEATALPRPPIAYTSASETPRAAFARTGVGAPPRHATGPPISA